MTSSAADAEAERRKFPLAPLLATLGVQTLSTMAAYSIPPIAPEVARHLGIPPAWVGFFISTVYGVGVLSALFSPRFIQERGAVLVSQGVLVATIAMLLVAAIGTAPTVALGAALMGLAYGATAPASTHMLVPLTPPSVVNVVLSIRQIGVPLGGVLASLMMPPMALHFGWQASMLAEIVPVLLLLAYLQYVRPTWDRKTSSHPGRAPSGLLEPFRMLRTSVALRRLTAAVFVFSGLQLCFVAFTSTQLTTVVGLDLVTAGWMLATYQISGVISRPIWGWLADKVLAARWLLVVQSVLMCIAALGAGQLWRGAPLGLLLAISILGGASASGYTGIAYGEYARIGGAKRTEATGLGAASMFLGVLVLPSLMSITVLKLGGYSVAYSSIGILAVLGGLLLALPIRRTSV